MEELWGGVQLRWGQLQRGEGDSKEMSIWSDNKVGDQVATRGQLKGVSVEG